MKMWKYIKTIKLLSKKSKLFQRKKKNKNKLEKEHKYSLAYSSILEQVGVII